MRVLVIADYLPYPLISGGRIRTYNLIRRAAEHHEIYLAAFLETNADAQGIPHLQEFCTRVETACFQRRSRIARVPGLVQFALAGKPPELKLLHSEELMNKVHQMASEVDFDIVQIETAQMALYLEALPKDFSGKKLLMFHNFTFQQYERVFKVEKRWDVKLRARLNSLAMGYWEPRYAEHFDRCTVVSEADRQLISEANPRLKPDVIPNGVDTIKYQPLPPLAEDLPPSLLFIGSMIYPPCADAALYFCREILPLIRSELETAEFWVVGRAPRSEVLELSGNGVHVTGYVDEIMSYYRKSHICVVPLRAGGGTRLKILEAMALGKPVISTSIGCEGLDMNDGEHLLIADTPAEFAEKTIRLFRDRELYRSLSAKGRQRVETMYGWDTISSRLMKIYEEMLPINQLQFENRM